MSEPAEAGPKVLPALGVMTCVVWVTKVFVKCCCRMGVLLIDFLKDSDVVLYGVFWCWTTVLTVLVFTLCPKRVVIAGFCGGVSSLRDFLDLMSDL